MTGIRFLALETVLELHRVAIADQGGDDGLRDPGLLDAALAMPRQQFGGEYLHPGIPAMAAAYAFHLCKNHPFVDGNKRAAFAAMIAFLTENHWRLDADPPEAEAVILRLASGELDKAAITEWVRSNAHAKPSLELRDFFRFLDVQAHFAQVEAMNLSGSAGEFAATCAEAEQAIPLIRHLRARTEELGGHTDRQVPAATFAGMTLMLVHLYRIAEEQGYEW